MELIIAEHSSNWSYFNALISTDVPFIFKENELLYLDNFISEVGIRPKGLKEGAWFSSDEYSKHLIFYLNNKRSGKSVYESKSESRGEVDYVDDKIHGKSISWFKNGQKKEDTDYVNGKKCGKCIFWYENGQKNYEIDYLDDKKHGKVITWYENGQK